MRIHLSDFDEITLHLANGHELHVATSRDGDLTRVRIDADPMRPPIILHYLTGRDEQEWKVHEAGRLAAGKARALAILRRTIAQLEDGDHV